jgi:deazaflavin-dependent oxidoreductase (nitroreductase family)
VNERSLTNFSPPVNRPKSRAVASAEAAGYAARREDARPMAASRESINVKPTAMERILNRAFGIAVSLGFGFSHSYLLEVRGRKSGRIFTTPVNLLDLNGKRFLVAARGETQWVRNARIAGRVSLRKGGWREEFTLRELSADERPPILKEFLDRFGASVQRFFPIGKGSPVESFAQVANRYPVFELRLARGADHRESTR